MKIYIDYKNFYPKHNVFIAPDAHGAFIIQL